MGVWRSIYYIFGFDYPKDLWCPRQRDLKYQVCLQIQKSEIRLNPTVKIKCVAFDLPPPPPPSPSEKKGCDDIILELKSVFKQKNKKYKRKRR